MTHDATLKIPALHCGGCVRTVTGILDELQGVEVGDADAGTKVVKIVFDDSITDMDEIRKALDYVGFSPE